MQQCPGNRFVNSRCQAHQFFTRLLTPRFPLSLECQIKGLSFGFRRARWNSRTQYWHMTMFKMTHNKNQIFLLMTLSSEIIFKLLLYQTKYPSEGSSQIVKCWIQDKEILIHLGAAFNFKKSSTFKIFSSIHFQTLVKKGFSRPTDTPKKTLTHLQSA